MSNNTELVTMPSSKDSYLLSPAFISDDEMSIGGCDDIDIETLIRTDPILSSTPLKADDLLQVSAETFDWQPNDCLMEEDITPKVEPAPVNFFCSAPKEIPVNTYEKRQRDSLISLFKSANKNKNIKKKKRGPAPKKTMNLLSKEFKPSDYTVLCGKGTEAYNYIGNKRFRATVNTFLEQYIDAIDDQREKSVLVATVLFSIKDQCPKDGAFVKFENGRWWSVDERTAREKIGACFRDYLSGHYRSSAKNKVARRRHLQQRQQQREDALRQHFHGEPISSWGI